MVGTNGTLTPPGIDRTSHTAHPWRHREILPGPDLADPQDLTSHYVRRGTGDYVHPVGTCMGTDHQAVVSRWRPCRRNGTRVHVWPQTDATAPGSRTGSQNLGYPPVSPLSAECWTPPDSSGGLALRLLRSDGHSG